MVPAGSCATMVRVFWPELFEVVGDHDAAARARRVGRAHPRAVRAPRRPGRPLPPLRPRPAATVALHASCHMLRELRIVDQPAALAEPIDGCEVVDWDGADRCCGFGGTFSVKLPEASVAMADEKLGPSAAADPTSSAGRLRHVVPDAPAGPAEATGGPSTSATWPRCWPRRCPERRPRRP